MTDERITPKTLDGVRELVFDIQDLNTAQQIDDESFDGLVTRWNHNQGDKTTLISVWIGAELAEFYRDNPHLEPVVTIVPRNRPATPDDL